MVFELILPKSDTTEPRGSFAYFEKLLIENGNSIVLVGANGAGKTRLADFLSTWVGAIGWEAQNLLNEQAQRSVTVSAQRVLPTVFAQPKNDTEVVRSQFYDRMSSAKGLLIVEDQFADLYSLIITEEFEASRVNRQAHKNYHTQGEPMPPYENTSLDKIREIWDFIYHPRKLSEKSSRGMLGITNEDGSHYGIESFSDGEKIAFYLLGKCISAPPNRVLIIDEPEIHLHRSILSALWDKLEAARADCLFVYLTHDVEFAASRVNAKKIWIESFDGNGIWKWHEIAAEEGLPQELLLKLVGSRRAVLFVEGESNSDDYAIYRACYPEFRVIPVGGHENVKDYTKSFRGAFLLHHLEVYGLIDRDYRSSSDIGAYQADNIYTIDVVEIEHLFLVPEVVRIIAKRQGLNPEEILGQLENRFLEWVEADIDTQTAQRTSTYIRESIGSFKGQSHTLEGFVQEFEAYSTLDVESLYKESRELYEEICRKRNYSLALRYYKKKVLSRVDGIFGFNKKYAYRNLILYLLKNAESQIDGQHILAALKQYLPTIGAN